MSLVVAGAWLIKSPPFLQGGFCCYLRDKELTLQAGIDITMLRQVENKQGKGLEMVLTRA